MRPPRPDRQKPDRSKADTNNRVAVESREQGPAPAGLAVRQVAVHILDAVLVKRQPLERALEMQATWLAPLETRDRGFALTIVRTVLRRLLFLDAVVTRLIEKPLPAEAGRVRLILLVGAAQIALLETPAHAAVNLAVEQCQRDRALRRFDKLVNAVLRRVPDSAKTIAATWDAPKSDTPAWLFARWAAAYGEASARRIAAANLHRAALDISVRSDAETWAATLGARLLPTGSLRIADAGAIPDLPGFAGDAWWVQDTAAAIPARLLGEVKGLRIADLCAAPGGKTAQLAAAGARVTAVDSSTGRLKRLAENMARLQLAEHVTVHTSDIESFTSAEPFDAVLLDAPCSATGTIRRHPDILHLKTPEDIARLATLQGRLLTAAARLVRPGGRLIYCTCSLEPEEGAEQITRFLAAAPQFSRLVITANEIGGSVDWITGDGDLRTLPFHLPDTAPEMTGLDGFFAARLVRSLA